MKKVYLLLNVLLSTIICLCACNHQPAQPTDNYPKQLDTPTVSYFKSVVSWNEIENADKYEISINDKITVTYNTSYTLNITQQALNYDIKVKAISEKPEYLNSAFSSVLSFDTYFLPTTEIKNITYSEEKDSVNLLLNFQGDYVKLYINDKLDKAYTSKSIALSNTQFNVGENNVALIACSENYAICDSDKLDISVYKNKDFNDIRYEDGKLLCSLNQSEIEYDTSALPAGESEQVIRNKNNSMSQITLSSQGIVKSIKKLESPKIESCSIKEVGGWTYIINVTLTGINVIYDRIELITNSKTFPKSFICDSKNIVYENNQLNFVFNISRTSAMGFETFDLKLYKEGYIATSYINCQNI